MAILAQVSAVQHRVTDTHMPDDATDLTMPRADGEQRLEANLEQSGGRTRYSMVTKTTDTVDAVEILGEEFPNPGPSLWSVLFHAIMHKPLLVFLPAIPNALVMYATALFPHCTITEEEVPLSGALSRFEEFICSRVAVATWLTFTAAQGPALNDNRFMDRYAYGVTVAYYAIPDFAITTLLVIATDCGTANRTLWLILYHIVFEICTGCTGYVLLCFLATSRMRGMENWWNPMMIIRNRSMKGFLGDLTGFALLLNGLVTPIVYVAIDVAFIATSPAKGWRPVFTMMVKKVSYMLLSQGVQRLGNAYKIWGFVSLSAILGLNTAFAALQCDSWGSLGVFIFLDCLSFGSRIWCHSGRFNTGFGYYFRRYLLFGKSTPPDGIPKPVFRGFEIVIEGLGLSIGFATMVIVFFLSDPRISAYPMLRKLCFPYGWQSFYYCLAMMASDMVQDLSGVVWVAHRVRYDFSKLLGHPLAHRNLPYLAAQSGSWWAMGWLVNFGWLFQKLQAGPFAPRV